MKRLLFIIFILATLVACKKKNTFIVKVVNPVTGQGYANLGIQIEACRTGAYENKCKVVHTSYTNDDGVSYIEERLKKNWRHRIFADLPEDYCYSSGISIFVKEGDKEFIFERAPCAQLKLKIENVNCQGEGDKMVLFQGNQIGSFNFNQPWEHNGCAFWETNGYSNVPMGEIYYRWEVTRSGSKEIFYDTIYLEEGEQRVYEILY